MGDTQSYIARLNRRYRVAQLKGWAKGTAIVLGGVVGWGAVTGLINYIR